MNLEHAARVLCVEDDENIRVNAVEALSDAGFDVLEAESFDAAMAILAGQYCPDVLFTDVAMPGKFDGVDLAAQLRRQQPRIPVLVTSGYAEQLGTRLGALSAPTEFIGKPYKLSEVVRLVKALAQA